MIKFKRKDDLYNNIGFIRVKEVGNDTYELLLMLEHIHEDIGAIYRYSEFSKYRNENNYVMNTIRGVCIV